MAGEQAPYTHLGSPDNFRNALTDATRGLWPAASHNDRYFLLYEFGGQRRQPLIASIGPSDLKGYVSIFDEAGILEAVAKFVEEASAFGSCSAVEKSDDRHRRLLRMGQKWPCR